MPEVEVWSVGRLLQWTANYLKQKGADSARLDAEVLLAHALGCKRIDLYTRYGEEPDEPRRQAFRDLVRRRAEGTPVAYLVGQREFYSLNFRVSPDVLIPRPETELVVIRLLDLVKQRPSAGEADPPLQIADIGTGSGVLAVCAARSLPTAEVTAVDISPAALAMAQANAQQHGVADRIRFVESDLFAAFEPDGDPPLPPLDFILSNPPYVKSGEMAELPLDVHGHEPHLALEAGPDGLRVIRPLIAQAAERLKWGGYLLCEISPQLEGGVAALLAGPAWSEVTFVKDFAHRVRVVQARKR